MSDAQKEIAYAIADRDTQRVLAKIMATVHAERLAARFIERRAGE